MEQTSDRIVRGVPAVVEELGLAHSESGRAAIGVWFFQGCMDLLQPLDGVAETIGRLRDDYKLGVITNGSSQLQRAKCNRLGLGAELVIISGEVGYEKPDARIFAGACSLAGVEPREALFVGDRLDVDMTGAKAAGMRAVWFNHWGGFPDGATRRPDAEIERFAELPGVLATM
jgi:putative hydrolase of the HAD superfamily